MFLVKTKRSFAKTNHAQKYKKSQSSLKRQFVDEIAMFEPN
jgi:hypothetical protein